MARWRSMQALWLVLMFAFSAMCAVSAQGVQESPTVRTAPPQQIEPPGQTPTPETNTETERYTLSHERYAKAVAYSRAGYTLYFLSVFIVLAMLLLALRLGWVARIRDFAQRTT
jgi:hypothetical protein